jgi:hypothetical protein
MSPQGDLDPKSSFPHHQSARFFLLIIILHLEIRSSPDKKLFCPFETLTIVQRCPPPRICSLRSWRDVPLRWTCLKRGTRNYWSRTDTPATATGKYCGVRSWVQTPVLQKKKKKTERETESCLAPAQMPHNSTLLLRRLRSGGSWFEASLGR